MFHGYHQVLGMNTVRVRTLAFVGLFVAGSLLPGQVGAEDYLDYFEQGEFALRVQKWDKAIELATKSISDNLRFFFAYHIRAIAYSKKGEYDKSIEDLKKVVELNPDYSDAYFLMGLVYEIKKDYASALNVYKEALAREKSPRGKEEIKRYIQDTEARARAR
jgi:tetratricopeptide (TPR) repeat protein